MKVLILKDHGEFGANFHSSLSEGMGYHSDRPTIIGPHIVKTETEIDDKISSLKELPDIIVGPNSTKLAFHLLEKKEIANIPIVSTQITSAILPTKNENYFQFAISDEFRVKLLLTQISKLYKKNRDLYLFTKKDAEVSYSSHLRKEILKQYLHKTSEFKNHILHDEFFEIEVAEIPLELNTSSTSKKVTRNIKLSSTLNINYKYPIVICSESMAASYLVKYLRDQGVTNKIFAFGTGKDMFKRTMINTYLISNEDDDTERKTKSSSSEKDSFRKDKVTFDFGNHLREYTNGQFKLENLKAYYNQIEERQAAMTLKELPIAVRRMQKSYKTKLVKNWDNIKLKYSLFEGRIINNSKLIGVYLAFSILLVALITLVMKVI